MTRLTGILLAAGQGRRFGSNKLLHPLDDGTPLVLGAARRLKAALPHSIVVVSAQDEEVVGLLQGEGISVVLNHSAAAGMGTSLATGVRATRASDGWVIALADMPWLQTRTILSVAAALDGPTSIAAPCYGNKRGHPVGFGGAYAEALMQLGGEAGARGIVEVNREHLKLIETRDRGAITDIDHPDELRPAGAGWSGGYTQEG